MHIKKLVHSELLVGILLSLFISSFTFIFNKNVAGPIIHGDEAGYLLNASAIAGFPNDFASSYFSGYSFMIAPAFYFFDEPYIIWEAVKAINSILLFLFIFSLWIISNKLDPNIKLYQRATVVTLVALYPMWITLTGYSISQIAFVLVFSYMFYTYLFTINGGVLSWLLLGLMSGYLYWIHPIGIAPIIALCTTLFYISLRRKTYTYYLVFLSMLLLIILFYVYVITPWLLNTMTTSGLPPAFHYPKTQKIFLSLLSLSGLTNIISILGGHLFYITIGSLGLVWLGFSVFTDIKNQIPSKSKMIYNPYFQSKKFRFSIQIFLTLSLALSTIISVLFLSSLPNPEKRLDHWMYGRYLEGVIPPMMMLGILYGDFRKLLWTIPIALICAILLALNLSNYLNTAPFNVSAFWQEFLLRDAGLWAWLISGCILIFSVALLPKDIAKILIFSTFIVSNYFQINWHNYATENAKFRWNSALKVREKFDKETCIGFDYNGINSYYKHLFWFDFGFLLFDYNLMRMTSNDWAKTCNGPFFSYDSNFYKKDNLKQKVYPIILSQRGGPIAWMKGNPYSKKIYPIIVEDFSPFLAMILGSGWYAIEDTHVWSSKEASLNLLIPSECTLHKCFAEITFSTYGASLKIPIEVIFEIKNFETTESIKLVFDSSEKKQILIPMTSNLRAQHLTVKIPNATSPKKLVGSADSRILGISLYSIHVRTNE